jgi:hypothetical protein
LPGETNSTLNIVGVNANQGGRYDAIVSNPAGTTTSGAAVLTVNAPPGSPIITTQPQNQQAAAGESAALSVAASGAPPLSFQWYQGTSGETNQPISGATNNDYHVLNVTNDLSFWVRVTNAVGSIASDTATVTIKPSAARLDQWLARNPLPQNNTLSAVTFVNGTFVAVGQRGAILTSPDGADWTSRTSGTTNGIYAVTYGNGTFVAAGDSGTVLTSPDGMVWTSHASGLSFRFLGASYAGSTFAIVGEAGAVLTSSDGFSWNSRHSGRLDSLSAIANRGDIFFAVGGSIISSPDGVGWTARTEDSRF